MTESGAPPTSEPNGAAMAALLSAGLGAFAVGLLVILNEAGLYVAPSLYGPAGGVSGRTTFAVILWLIAWFFTHKRWKSKDVNAGKTLSAALLLVLLGLLLTFPPLWSIFG